MPDFELDVVSVAHRQANWDLMAAMFRDVFEHHRDRAIRAIGIDNRVENLGFAKGCNYGAMQGYAPIIGLLNPDTMVLGPFLDPVQAALAEPDVVITGCRFGKSRRQLEAWGINEWICGATFFVRRDFWESVGGFDERFYLYFEETDLIRQAETAGLRAKAIELPLFHASPEWDPQSDVSIKHHWYDRSARLYFGKWASG